MMRAGRTMSERRCKRKKGKRRMIAALAVLICLFGLVTGQAETAWADETPPDRGLSGQVSLLRQDDNDYIMQVTVENRGEDFSGTVQVIFSSFRSENCAYNTQMALPAQGKKQFTLTVTDTAVDVAKGICVLNFLDEKENVVQTISLKNVFGNTRVGIPVGILSDQYSNLTFMDAGGGDFALWDLYRPLELVLLERENLKESLDGLFFLIIDRFNVSSLGEENIRAIEDWVRGGGWLLIGTGSYGEQTLSGFDKDFMDIEVAGVSEPGEKNEAADNAKRYQYYYDYTAAGIDLTAMAVASLDYGQTYPEEGSNHPAVYVQAGEGVVSVFLFSFGEEALKDLSDSAIQTMYEETMYRSGSYHFYNGNSSDMSYAGRKLLSLIDNDHTDVDFIWLEVLIGCYVVLIGPVLYLILRRRRKSEWYWIGVPVLGLLFIAGVYIFGQGAQVRETRIYSVTAQQSGSSQAETWFMGYQSGVKSWKVRLNERYAAAGPGWDGYISRNATANDYFYTISRDGEGLWMGIKPRGNFDNGYFYARGTMESKGSLTGENLELSGLDRKTNAVVSGTVVNGTSCDLAYLGVCVDSGIAVFSDVKAGEVLDLSQAMQEGRCVYQRYMDFYDEILYDVLYSGWAYSFDDLGDMSALVIGLGLAEEKKPSDSNAVVIGVVKDYDKAVAGNCEEVSYGCLYSYAEAEVDNIAAD